MVDLNFKIEEDKLDEIMSSLEEGKRCSLLLSKASTSAGYALCAVPVIQDTKVSKCIDGSVLTDKRITEANNKLELYRKVDKKGDWTDTFYEADLAVIETALEFLKRTITTDSIDTALYNLSNIN